MAQHYGPYIVTDGLVLCLDAKDGLGRGPNLISNGEFTDGTSGWTGYAGTTLSRAAASSDPGSASGGSDDFCLKVSGTYMAYTSISTVIGKSYWVALRGYEGGGDPGRNSLKISNTSDGGNLTGTSEVYITPDATWVAKTQTFTATATTTYIRVGANSGGGGGSNLSYFDSISVYEMLWKDLSGNGNDGSVTSAVYNSSGYFDFDGTDDMVKISAGFSFNDNNEGTIAAWVKHDGSGNGYIGAFRNNANKWFSLRPGGTYIGIYDYYNGTRAIGSCSTTAVDDSKWHYITRAKTNGTTSDRFYVDGITQSYSITDGALEDKWFDHHDSGTLEFLIAPRWANGAYGGFYDGNIATVHVYSRPLSQSEILQNFNAQRGRFGV